MVLNTLQGDKRSPSKGVVYTIAMVDHLQKVWHVLRHVETPGWTRSCIPTVGNSPSPYIKKLDGPAWRSGALLGSSGSWSHNWATQHSTYRAPCANCRWVGRCRTTRRVRGGPTSTLSFIILFVLMLYDLLINIMCETYLPGLWVYQTCVSFWSPCLVNPN